MDFSSFLRPYMITIYHVIETEGRYEGGVWVPGEPERTPFRAAVVPFNDDSLQFGEAGTYTADDEKIFTYRKLYKGQKVEIRSEAFTITEERDYSFYARGLRMYVGRSDGDASH